MSENPQVRGAAIVDVIRFIKSTEYSFDAILELTSAFTQAALQKRVGGLTHYDYSVFTELLEAADEVFADLDDSAKSAAEQAGAFAARSNLESKLGFFVKLYAQSPTRLIRSCSHVWQLFFNNAGAMTTASSSPNKTSVRILGFPAIKRVHCRYMFGWMSEALAFINVDVVEAQETSCARNGDDFCEFMCTWDSQGSPQPSKAASPKSY